MKVYRISKCQYIDDLKGTGAANYAGRWHNKGTYVLYTAATASLALLESVVHMAKIPADGYCMICLEIPENNIQEIFVNNLPANWQAQPSPDILKSIGDSFIREGKFFALKLPSAIMPEDFNYLLNPNHPDASSIKIVFKRLVQIDDRLLKN